MRSPLLILFLFLALSSFAQSSGPLETDPMDSFFKARYPKVFAEIGNKYPEFKFKRAGKTINNNSIQGKVVLINFWFEACAPCMAEMDALNQLFENLAGNKDFVFISISKDSEEIIKKVKKKYKLSFDSFSASEEECKRLNFGGGYPTTIVLDKSGTVKFIHIGGPIEKDGAEDRIKTVLLPEIQSLF